MRIVVIGAYGLLGGYVTARLLAAGHAVVGVGRSVIAARRRFPAVEWLEIDIRTATVTDWRKVVRSADAVVNCAGALQDSRRDDLEAVHKRVVTNLAQACAEEGIRRFVHISAAGIGENRSRFGRTKLQADAALRSADLEWVILRPGVVLAPAAYGGSALLRGLAGFPGFIPALKPDAVVQTVSAEDVAEAVARSLEPDHPARFEADLVANEQTSLGEILLAMRTWLGLPPAPILPVPASVGRAVASFADALGWLGWRSPMRGAALEQLSLGVRGRSEDSVERLGFRVSTLSVALAVMPSGVQERWFARLYFLKPLGLATLALFWGASGIIGLIQHREASLLLTQASVPPTLASAFVLGGGVADIALAMLVCIRRTAAAALWGMVALTAAYLAAATLVTPNLWADPLGPLVKSIPAAVLALIALATLEER